MKVQFHFLLFPSYSGLIVRMRTSVLLLAWSYRFRQSMQQKRIVDPKNIQSTGRVLDGLILIGIDSFPDLGGRPCVCGGIVFSHRQTH